MKKNLVGRQHFELDDSIFHRRVYVFLNYSHADFAKFARKKGATDYNDDPEFDKNFSGFSTEMDTKTGPTEWVICIKNFDWTIRDQGTLIHEIVHTVIKIFKTNNIPNTPDNQEFLALSVSNLYEDICRKIFKVKKPRKKKK